MKTAEKIYAMPGNENLWQVAAQSHRILAAANISHSVCGDVAVCLHGFQRKTVDLDLSAGKDFRRKSNRRGKYIRSTSPRGPSFHFVWSLVAASREVLLGREHLPKPATIPLKVPRTRLAVVKVRYAA